MEFLNVNLKLSEQLEYETSNLSIATFFLAIKSLHLVISCDIF